MKTDLSPAALLIRTQVCDIYGRYLPMLIILALEEVPQSLSDIGTYETQ